MKNYISNLNGLHVKYLIINIIISIAAYLVFLVVGDIGLDNKINMYISIIMMILILSFFIIGRKKYQSELIKIKDLPFGQKLNDYQSINKKRLNSLTLITVVASIGFILSSNKLYIFFCFLSLTLILLNRSSKQKLSFELNLTQQELEKIENPSK
ncbi:MAG: hypothetical protein PHE13_01935 [Bacteroidales bacterium]|nr:hypothetical protein [Bacteroidales bacterium]MDD4829243.1 hypothetical protein [Bacteroidales bacterium]